MKPAPRSLCIVSRDPLQCSELVLSLQASLEPDDEVEIVMDRRRERRLFETELRADDWPAVERRSVDVDLEVRTKGFALGRRAEAGAGARRRECGDARARPAAALERHPGSHPGRGAAGGGGEARARGARTA